MKTQTIKQIEKELFNKGYFLRTHYDGGIRFYKIWLVNQAEVIAERLTTKDLKEKARELLN